MSKRAATTPAPERAPFDGLELHDLEEVDVQSVNATIWIFMKRRDGSIVRMWIRHPSRDEVPLLVTVEVEDV